MKYRKTALVDAIQYRPHQNCREVAEFIGTEFWPEGCDEADQAGTLEWNVQTLEGIITCQPGDWILKGIEGECWPIRRDIFEATYEPAALTEANKLLEQTIEVLEEIRERFHTGGSKWWIEGVQPLLDNLKARRSSG